LALEGFLLQTDFCKAELAGDDCCPAAILTQLVDFILLTNVDKWRDSQGFLTMGELSHCWQLSTEPTQTEGGGGKFRQEGCWDIPYC
jgi:hypothetical protein